MSDIHDPHSCLAHVPFSLHSFIFIYISPSLVIWVSCRTLHPRYLASLVGYGAASSLSTPISVYFSTKNLTHRTGVWVSVDRLLGSLAQYIQSPLAGLFL